METYFAPIHGGCSTLDSSDSRRKLEALHREQDERAAAVNFLRAEFARALQAREPMAPAAFSPRRWPKQYPHKGTRVPFVWEVIHDALDYGDFPQRVAQLVMDSASGKGSQRDAQALMEEVGAAWSEWEVLL
jgi:hypothetical protein